MDFTLKGFVDVVQSVLIIFLAWRVCKLDEKEFERYKNESKNWK